MADIRNIRSRPGVRIYLAPCDIVDILTQDEVVLSFNEEDRQKIYNALFKDQHKNNSLVASAEHIIWTLEHSQGAYGRCRNFLQQVIETIINAEAVYQSNLKGEENAPAAT